LILYLIYVVVLINVEMSLPVSFYMTIWFRYRISSWNYACVCFRKFWPVWCKQEELFPLTFFWSRLDGSLCLHVFN